jgi:hypothetical protein
MNGGLTQLAVWLNALANALGRVLLAPIAFLPGWLSATMVACVTGVLLLAMFKYTSNQRAVKRARDSIKANLLALKLFKDSTSTVFKAQGGILLGAGRLFLLSLVPMLVMAVPVILLMSQLGLWYQARPLGIGEETVLAVRMAGDAEAAWPNVSLEPNDAIEVKLGPVRVLSQRSVFWNIVGREPGPSQIVVRAGDVTAAKELAIGDGIMRTSIQRPGWHWSEVVLHPSERPFDAESPVQSIEIDYPPRDSWTSGTNTWIVYWFIASMVAAFCFRPWLNVNI